MNHNPISIIIGMWVEGYYSDSEVIEWAENQISNSTDEPKESLIELSLKGPKVCVKKPSYEFPAPQEFSFKEKFSIRLAKVDMKSNTSIKNFISWVAKEAMGEDTETPEVSFGYQLEHRLSYNEDDPLIYFKNNFNNFVSSSLQIVESLKHKACV